MKIENFESISKDKTILVDFYADWCGPCKMMSPIIDEIKDEYKDIDVYKINVDDNSELSRKYGVMSIPTIMIFKNGELKNKFIGMTSKETIINCIK